MIKRTFIITAMAFLLFSGCIKSSIPKTTFFEALEHIEKDENYTFDLQQYVEYEMKRDEEFSLDKYGSATTWSKQEDDFAWYIRSFKIDCFGVVGLINVVRANEDRLIQILDIATFLYFPLAR